MGNTQRPLIFVCHSSRDKPFVQKLADRLSQDGVDVWVDHLEIKVGDSIHNKINEGLSKSDFLVVVLSQASVKSRWVREELNSAASLEKLSDRGVFILPILLERCDVPPLFLDRRYANFLEDKDSAYKELIDGILHHFKSKHPDVDVAPLRQPEAIDAYAVALNRLVLNADILTTLPPRAFEEFVAAMFHSLGFGVELTSVSRDGGADVIAMKSPAPGLSPLKTIIECKRYAPPNKVGVAIVRQLFGVMQACGAAQGIIVTTSYFTKEAKHFASGHPIDLIDRDKLQEMMRTIDVATWETIVRSRASN